MIPNLESVQSIFSKMQSEGLDINKPLKWGFFFIDKNKESLLKVFNELKDYQYTIESLHESDDGRWVLQVSKIETLLPEKLHRRNISFNELAEHFNVELYDGWDVGPVEN